MKKFFALTLAFLMLVMLCSCMTPSITITRGTVNGDVYTNDVLGFEFTKPSSWTYSTDEEIAEALELGLEYFDDEKFKNALEYNPAIYDMMAVDSRTGTNINVGYENLKKTFSSSMTEEQYLNKMEEQVQQEATGMTVDFSDTFEKVKIGETEFTKCISTVKASGITMTQAYYVKNIGGYMSYIIVTVTRGYTVADIEAMFK